MKTPDGGYFYVASWLTSRGLIKFPYIKQLQFAKVRSDKIILRLRVTEKPGEEDINEIKAFYAAQMKGSYIDMDIEFVDRFEIGPSGKFKIFVDETV